jgi:hypothetical protein
MNVRDVMPGLLTASALAVVAGTLYIIDCRAAGGEVDKCWLTGLPIAGIGGAAGGGFRAGYETLNPYLRKPDDQP